MSGRWQSTGLPLTLGVTLVVALLLVLAWLMLQARVPPDWTPAERQIVDSLWLGHLGATPADPTNPVADLTAAAQFGQQLFFDTRLSQTGTFSCASCHQPERRFTDGLPRARAIGATRRNTPSIVGTAYSPWLYWDGRKDSQWSQALAPMEDPLEQGGNRLQFAHLIASDSDYRATYVSVFGALPDLSDALRFPAAAAPAGDAKLRNAWSSMSRTDRNTVNQIFGNLGKAIAAYERRLRPGPSRFDAYLEALRAGDVERQRALFSAAEARGLQLFIGKGNCIACHNGPLLTNNVFHNTGVISAPGQTPDKGRVQGLRQALADPFNCAAATPSAPEQCIELQFAKQGPEMIGAFRTPSLRNIRGTEPYMHAGQLQTIAQVIDHYDRAPNALIGHSEAKPLGLWYWEKRQLEAFLHTLDGSVVTADTGTGQLPTTALRSR